MMIGIKEGLGVYVDVFVLCNMWNNLFVFNIVNVVVLNYKVWDIDFVLILIV